MVNVSKFGKKIAETSGTETSGIGRLMDDLGNALVESRDILMLGGGFQPGQNKSLRTPWIRIQGKTLVFGSKRA